MLGHLYEPAHRRAIVIGASMVGLAAARALSERFREVVIIDRDRLPREAPDHRKGVPQSWHTHNLTLRGQRELEELFPGFVDEAVPLSDFVLRAAHYDRHSALELLDGIHLLKLPQEMVTSRFLAGLARYAVRRLTATLPPPTDHVPTPRPVVPAPAWADGPSRKPADARA